MLPLLRLLACVFAVFLVGFAVAQDKVIRANDKVKVVCEEEPVLNRDYIVTRDGFILMSFIGAVKISGLSEKAAGDRIEEELLRQRILRRATVTVTLLTSEMLPVRFSGAVRSPGELPWREGMRLNDIVNQAKPLDTADMEKVRIESRLEKVTTVNYTRYGGSNNTFNPLIQPGDFVFFPLITRETKAFVLGAVKTPGAIDVRPGMTLVQALEAAGGVLPQANPERIKLTREGAEERFLSLRAGAGGTVIQAGDRILVEAVSRDRIVIVMGGVRSPGSMGFTDGMTLGDAIRLAGGLQDGVKPGKVKLTRRVGTRTRSQDVDYKRISEGFMGDMNLQPGDRIDVPQPRRGSKGNELLGLALVFFFLFGR